MMAKRNCRNFIKSAKNNFLNFFSIQFFLEKTSVLKNPETPEVRLTLFKPTTFVKLGVLFKKKMRKVSSVPQDQKIINEVTLRTRKRVVITKNRPLRGTRLFLLLYPFRSKKTLARKTISKTKEKSAKVKNIDGAS